jgi:hypothetical protein
VARPDASVRPGGQDEAVVRPLVALVTAAVVALQLAACGDDDDTPPTQTGRTATATAPPDGIDTMPGASTRPVHVEATDTATALLRNVRAARHEGFDRVVFEFSNALPGYDIRYVRRPVRQDGSGKVVRIAGAHVVRILMENAADADLSQPSAPPTYTGPRRFRPGTPEVVELARAGGFEGVLTWVAGLRDRVDFRVTTLTAPARLVVDFRNH